MTAPTAAERRQLADRTMKARKEGTCPLCSGPVHVGPRIARTGTTWQHASCLVRTITNPEGA